MSVCAYLVHRIGVILIEQNTDTGEIVPTFSGLLTVQSFRVRRYPSLANLEGQFDAQDKLEGYEFWF